MYHFRSDGLYTRNSLEKKEKSDVSVKIYTEQIGKSKVYIEKMAKISWDRGAFFYIKHLKDLQHICKNKQRC